MCGVFAMMRDCGRVLYGILLLSCHDRPTKPQPTPATKGLEGAQSRRIGRWTGVFSTT